MREVQGPRGVVRPPMHTDAAWYRALADPGSGMHPPYGMQPQIYFSHSVSSR